MTSKQIVMEKSQKVISTLKVDSSDLPDIPYNLWIRGELEAYVDAPEGSRIEAIGGEIVVSPAATFEHTDTWESGETIRLPDPFDVEIDTSGWSPWDD